MREVVTVDELRLPPCPCPKPGQDVIWYRNARRYTGRIVGHRFDGKPTVAVSETHTDDIRDFDDLRPLDPFGRASANWNFLPSRATIALPSSTEMSTLKNLMQRTIPPGVSYADIASEIWSRGFEVFLVGGTVRDAITGTLPNDVDLITTIPLTKLLPLMKAMCRFELDEESLDGALKNGHIRIGGKKHSGDPFMDISIFKHQATGDYDALFGFDFSFDVAVRDFTYNSIYYDPNNSVFIDPTGLGLQDVDNKISRPVFDPSMRPLFEHAKILIRLFKFASRGYTPEPDYLKYIQSEAGKIIPAMSSMQRFNYIQSQIIGELQQREIYAALTQFREQFSAFGMDEEYSKYFSPLEEMILNPVHRPR